MTDRKPSVEIDLTLSCLRLDGGTQIRQAMRTDKVDEYAERMTEGSNFPPVDVFFDDENYWLADGFHRVGASAKIGRTNIHAIVHHGSLRDAILFSIRSNALHGIELTNEDKKAKIIRLLSDQEWSQWSVKALAEVARVSRSYFTKVKAEILAENILPVNCVVHDKAPSLTTKAIRKQVNQEQSECGSEFLDHAPRTTDSLGQLLPTEVIASFETNVNFSLVKAKLKVCVALVKKLTKEPGGKLLDEQILGYLTRCIEKLYEAEPYSVCQVCVLTKGEVNPLCGRCNGGGWVSRLGYQPERKKK